MMSNIYLTNEDMELFKRFVPSSEEIVYATYAKVGHLVGKIAYQWNSPIIITSKHIIFYQIEHSRIKQGIGMFPLYTTHVFKNYKHIYISLFDFRPIYDEKTGETKEDFKLRWKDFQKMILPHVINSQKEHLRIIEANKNNPEFYTKKDLEKLPYFGKQKSVEKNITKNLPKFEKIMENYS